MGDSGLKLPSINITRSPGSSPDVRRRSENRGDALRLPKLFRNRSASMHTARSLTNLVELDAELASATATADVSSAARSSPVSPSVSTTPTPSPTPGVCATEIGRTGTRSPVAKALSGSPSAPNSRGSPRAGIYIDVSLGKKPEEAKRSKSHTYRFPFAFNRKSSILTRLHQMRAGDVGVGGANVGVRKPPATDADGRPINAWSNKTTFFTRVASADDILHLLIDDLVD